MKITNKSPNGKYRNGRTRWTYTFQFNFTSRESYLAYRANWKARLAGYVADRRAWRIPRWDRSVAHQLEQERAAAKVEAQRQYQASKLVPAV